METKEDAASHTRNIVSGCSDGTQTSAREPPGIKGLAFLNLAVPGMRQITIASGGG